MATAAIAEDALSPAPEQTSGRALIYAAIVIVVGVFATTMAQPDVLGRLPLQNLLKNELHVSRSANAAFFFLSGLPWYFKPLAGILTDAFPIFGSRRRSYILISTALAVAGWLLLIVTPHTYGNFLWVCIGINLFMVVASCVVGGYMVEVAQATAGSGRLTALRQVVQSACLLIRGPVSGYLAAITFGWTAGACGAAMALLIPVTITFLREQRSRVKAQELFDNAGKQLVKIGSAGTMWAAAGLMLLFYLAPGIGTALFYKQQNELHLTTQQQGFLVMLGGAAGIVAALGYAYFCRRLNLRTLLVICLAASTASTLGYLFYSSYVAAQMIDTANGFCFSLAELALMDLAIRATPMGSEGLGFSLMMSVRNLALFGTDWLGSTLIDSYHVSINALVWANAGTTLITVPLIFLLPRILVRKKDAELYDEVAVPANEMQA